MVQSIGEDCVFTVEIDSKKHVKKISLSDEAYDPVIFEGSIGGLKEISIVESSSLELVGSNGTLRVEVDADILHSVFENPDHAICLSEKEGSAGVASEVK